MSPKDSPALSWDDLPGLFPALTGPERWLPLLRQHLRMVEDAAGHTRVTAVSEARAVWRQYAESLEILRIAVEAGGSTDRVVDVGSGGGYPGLVIACALPGARVDLVEPLQKRARLLTAMASELGLDTVRVHALRAEEAGRTGLRDSATLVTARAVCPLAELLEYTAPLAGTGGLVALPKGSGLEEEMSTAGRALEALACEPLGAFAMRPAVAENLRVLMVRKLAETDARYPRRPGTPRKRPI